MLTPISYKFSVFYLHIVKYLFSKTNYTNSFKYIPLKYTYLKLFAFIFKINYKFSTKMYELHTFIKIKQKYHKNNN